MFPVIPSDKKPPKTLPYFMVGGNGTFLVKRSALGVSVSKVDSIKHLPEVTENIDYQLPPIPAALSAQIAGFLREAYRRFHSEGALLLCMDAENNWQIVVPRQKVDSSLQVKYFVDEDTVPEGWRLLGTVHSHPFDKSKPSPSPTDATDERKIDGVHLVAGSLEQSPKYACTVSVDGVRWSFSNQQDIIEDAEPVEVPDEWLDKIDRPFLSKVVSTFTGGGYTGGAGGYSNGAYKSDWFTIRPNETPIQAFERFKETTIKYMQEDAAKIGYRVEFTLVPLEGGKSAEQAPPPEDTQEQVWADAEIVRCTGNHPNRLRCKKHCGCHCQACRSDTVGSFKPISTDDDISEVTMCECKVCWEGCDSTVYTGEDDDLSKPALCTLCKHGTHYEDYAAKATTGKTGV